MKKNIFILFFIIPIFKIVLWAEWEKASQQYVWQFPRDHGPHRSFQTEWWYFTGHVSDRNNPVRKFGYQFTFFRIGVIPSPIKNSAALIEQSTSAWTTQGLIMGHAALSDIHQQEHRFSSLLYRESPLFGQFNDAFSKNPPQQIAWSQAPTGSSGQWTLEWNGQAFDIAMIDQQKNMSFSLKTLPLKPLIFQGKNGFSPKNADQTSASLYYSFTRLKTTGVINIDGSTFTVEGISWMDKEFSSNQLAPDQTGWDWFSLQLNDGRELMLYLMRGPDNTLNFSKGNIISQNAQQFQGVRSLTSDDFTLSTTRTWTSPQTNATYPMGWRLEIPSEQLDLEIQSALDDQENTGTGPGLPYWEGAVEVLSSTHQKMGQGYVELTGYGKPIKRK